MRVLDSESILYFWQVIKGKFVAQQDGKTLSTNDFSDAAKAALDKVVADMQSMMAYVSGVREIAEGKQSPATTLSGYGISDAYSKSEVDLALNEINAKVNSVMHYKGSVQTYGELPVSGNEVGDYWIIRSADEDHGVSPGDSATWNGEDWDINNGSVDLSPYLRIADLSRITNEEIDDMVANA